MRGANKNSTQKENMERKIYLDHAATTKVDEKVLKKMLPYFDCVYGNANSQHGFGREAMTAVDNARDTIASIIGAKPNEIYFTSGGTEANNWALRGSAYINADKGKHLIVSCIEHASIIETAKELETYGFSVTYIPVDERGIVSVDDIKNAIRKDTVFIGIMYANNEVGTVQPIREISAIAKEKGITFFSDCVQASGAFKLDVNDLGVDLMSVSSHKINGPKGIGFLYIKNGTKLASIITGGHQERTKRGGTLNVPAIVGFAEAFRLTNLTLLQDTYYVKTLRDRFINGVESNIDGVKLIGDRQNRLPSNANFFFDGVQGETLLFALDLNGIAASSGSACSSGSLVPSHVLTSMGLDEKQAKSCVRFSFGKENTIEEVDYCLKVLIDEVNEIRSKNK